MAKKDKLGKMQEALGQADANARARDRRVDAARGKKQELPNIAVVDAEEAKANATKHTIVKLRDKNKAAFTQLVNDNFIYLIQKSYLTRAEESMILRLMPFVELNSNALTMIQKTDGGFELVRGKFPKIKELAEFLSADLSTTSKTINQLIRKGILYEIVDTETLKKHGRAIEERPIYFNPEIIVAADKNQINLTLCRIHWANDRLEKTNIKLPWKIWYAPGAKYGRLYRRKTWLQKKKNSNKNT